MPESNNPIATQSARLRQAILQRHGYADDVFPFELESSPIDDATGLATVTTHWGIVSDAPIAGRLIVLAKRVLRIAMRWYINPIVAQQNAFNEAVVGTLHELQAENDRLRAMLAERDSHGGGE